MLPDPNVPRRRGKKIEYLAHATIIEVGASFAFIKAKAWMRPPVAASGGKIKPSADLSARAHIVTVFDLGQELNQPYRVTELMGGGVVEDLLEEADRQSALAIRPSFMLGPQAGAQTTSRGQYPD